MGNGRSLSNGLFSSEAQYLRPHFDSLAPVHCSKWTPPARSGVYGIEEDCHPCEKLLWLLSSSLLGFLS